MGYNNARIMHIVGFEEEIIKNRGEKRDNTYVEEI